MPLCYLGGSLQTSKKQWQRSSRQLNKVFGLKSRHRQLFSSRFLDVFFLLITGTPDPRREQGLQGDKIYKTMQSHLLRDLNSIKSIVKWIYWIHIIGSDTQWDPVKYLSTHPQIHTSCVCQKILNCKIHPLFSNIIWTQILTHIDIRPHRHWPAQILNHTDIEPHRYWTTPILGHTYIEPHRY